MSLHHGRRAACLLLIAGTVVWAGCRAATPPAPAVAPAELANAVRSAVEADAEEEGTVTPAQREELVALYQPRNFAPLWSNADGRPSADARAALALLTSAAEEGLDPDDYSAAAVASLAAALTAGRTPAPNDSALFDAALSANTLRYLHHLHSGRVDPRALGIKMSTPIDVHDYGEILRGAVATHAMTETAAKWAPPLVLYRGMRRALDRYRAMAADTAFDDLPQVGKSVHAGEPYAGLRALHQRLIAFGDLAADVPAPEASAVFGGDMVEGVKAFQSRHGLQADGVLGKRTQELLAVPIARRVRQLELALERLRWLPDLGNERFLAVNIPMFHLWGWDTLLPDGLPSFDMGVIVGKSLDTQTPVFVDEMKYIIFRPYWNVPPSIVKKETIPALRKNPNYLVREDMEIVDGQGDNARPVATTADSIARLASGRLRVRQRPGPKNSLGLVKFVFPNDDNVYLHDTPADYLFEKDRRDLSHGCVRLADPVKLALWALADQPEWTREKIVEAMQSSTPRRVDLTRPIRVILFYLTAVVMPEDGSVRFADDIYGHDAVLERALELGRKPR